MELLEYKPLPHYLPPMAMEIIFEKLKKHFKLRYRLEFRKLRGYLGRCFSYGRIVVRPNGSVETLCHEIAHAIDFKRHGYHKYMRCHSKRHVRLCRMVENYCIKKNYWQDEIRRRTTVIPKPVPTAQEIRQQRIAKRKADLLRYERKLSFYSHKITKAKRSIAMLEKQQAIS